MIVTFISHCELCTFGSLQYECPACKKEVEDDGPASVGWESAQGQVPTFCPNCKISLNLDATHSTVEIALHRIIT